MVEVEVEETDDALDCVYGRTGARWGDLALPTMRGRERERVRVMFAGKATGCAGGRMRIEFGVGLGARESSGLVCPRGFDGNPRARGDGWERSMGRSLGREGVVNRGDEDKISK